MSPVRLKQRGFGDAGEPVPHHPLLQDRTRGPRGHAITLRIACDVRLVDPSARVTNTPRGLQPSGLFPALFGLPVDSAVPGALHHARRTNRKSSPLRGALRCTLRASSPLPRDVPRHLLRSDFSRLRQRVRCRAVGHHVLPDDLDLPPISQAVEHRLDKLGVVLDWAT